jgi:hypothetical protein
MVGLGQSGEGGQRWWYRFNALVLAREGRRQDEALLKDKVEAVSLSSLHGKEAQHGTVAPGWGNGGDDTYWADGNLIGLKMKKTHVVDSVATNGR